MTIKKDLVIAVLATFCLTATLFIIVPTRSQMSYDPWLDTNDDGIIDIEEIYNAALAYGTMGDPTKNVNIVLMPQKVLHVWENQSIFWTTGTVTAVNTGWVGCEGYSRIFIYLRVTNISSHQQGTTKVYISFIHWFPDATTWTPFIQNVGQPTLQLWYWDTDWAVAKYEVQGSYCSLQVTIESPSYSGVALCSIYVYLRNE